MLQKGLLEIRIGPARRPWRGGRPGISREVGGRHHLVDVDPLLEGVLEGADRPVGLPAVADQHPAEQRQQSRSARLLLCNGNSLVFLTAAIARQRFVTKRQRSMRVLHQRSQDSVARNVIEGR